MSGPFGRILVGYVPTEQGADAEGLGVDLALACSADLLLVSVIAGLRIERVGEPIGPSLVHRGGRDRAASALKEAVGELAGMRGLGHVERRLEVSSSPSRGLHETAAATQADLVVVGSSHHGPVGRVLLGSVGERLLSGAPCAVAIAPRGHAARDSRPIRVIAVAFDGSPEAQLALRTGHELARLTEAVLQVLMVIEPPAAIPGQFVPLPGLEPVIVMERAEALQHQEQAAHNALDGALADRQTGERASSAEFCSGPTRRAPSSSSLAQTSICCYSAPVPTAPYGGSWSAACRAPSLATRRARYSSRPASASAQADAWVSPPSVLTCGSQRG